jgi:hypothetical protein
MKRMIKSDIRRFLTSFWFWCPVVVGWACLVYNSSINTNFFDRTGYLNRFLVDCVMDGGGLNSVILPLLCAGPFGCALWEDVSGGMIQQQVSRMGYMRYGAARSVSTALSGGLAALFIFGGYFIALFIVDPSPSKLSYTMFAENSFGYIYAHSMLAYCLVFLAGVFMFGAANALMCMGIAALCRNHFVGWGFPFLLYHCAYYLIFITPPRINEIPISSILLAFIPYYTYVFPGIRYTWIIVSQFSAMFLFAALIILITLRRRYIKMI